MLAGQLLFICRLPLLLATILPIHVVSKTNVVLYFFFAFLVVASDIVLVSIWCCCLSFRPSRSIHLLTLLSFFYLMSFECPSIWIWCRFLLVLLFLDVVYYVFLSFLILSYFFFLGVEVVVLVSWNRCSSRCFLLLLFLSGFYLFIIIFLSSFHLMSFLSIKWEIKLASPLHLQYKTTTTATSF